MNKDQLEKYVSKRKGSKDSYPFGPDVLVYKVMGKMFALVSQQNNTQLTLKCSPADGLVLTSQFDSVVPGYHMNKKHWITIQLKGDVSKHILLDLVDKSYALVVSKLTKKDKSLLEQSTDRISLHE